LRILDRVPRTPRRPAALTGTMFSGGDAVTDGLLTPADLRSRAWQQVLRGIYTDAAITLTHRHRCLAVARFVLPDGGVIAGRSAAYLYGARLVGPTDPVEILVPPTARIRSRGDLVVHTGVLPAAERQAGAALPLTTPLRTCWDLAQWLDPMEAVVHVDALAAARSVDLAQFRQLAKGHQSERGWRRALRVATLADSGAASPPESRLRVRLVLAGIPKPVTQFVIAHNGRFVARVDLAWPECGVAVEYDGEWHAGTDQFHTDRRRLNQLMGAGWIVLHVTAKRLREDFDGFVGELRAALRSRRSAQM
jgi:very-short-patch-repair endonuclease